MSVGWFRKVARQDMLQQTIMHILRSSINFADIKLANDYVTRFMQGADDSVLLQNAINNAATLVANEQQGYLSEQQRQIVLHLQNRIQENLTESPSNLQQSEPANLEFAMPKDDQEQKLK